MPEIFIRSRFNNTLLLIFGQANILQSLFDVKAKIAFVVEMLSPSGNKFSHYIFCFGITSGRALPATSAQLRTHATSPIVI
jgi:hypothetical protein